jgi:L-aspartate oxidase
MAWPWRIRAGAAVANLEFVQFHPTALYPAEGQAVLISEAVRGEGAQLRTIDGEPVMQAHPMGSLATRDVVAQEIDRVLKETGAPHVLLDLSPSPRPTRSATAFPYILEACAGQGIDADGRADPRGPRRALRLRRRAHRSRRPNGLGGCTRREKWPVLASMAPTV